jgi:4-hydroxy-tetrahydrodipicolinate synthase
MILSGDDGMTYEMMTDPQVKAAGVISVASNVAPKAVTQMVQLLNEDKPSTAQSLMQNLEPLFGKVSCRARNPLAYKALMSLLGMPSGGCRQPLGKMTQNGLKTVLDAVRKVQATAPEILQPVAEFFNVDIAERLANEKYQEGLAYESY